MHHHPSVCESGGELARGSAIVEVLVAAVILAIVAAMTLAATAGGSGLLQRGLSASAGAVVLGRALDLARAGGAVPGSMEGFTLTTVSGALPDVSVVSWGTNGACQGSCTPSLSALGGLRRVEITASAPDLGSGPTTLRGMTFTGP